MENKIKNVEFGGSQDHLKAITVVKSQKNKKFHKKIKKDKNKLLVNSAVGKKANLKRLQGESQNNVQTEKNLPLRKCVNSEVPKNQNSSIFLNTKQPYSDYVNDAALITKDKLFNQHVNGTVWTITYQAPNTSASNKTTSTEHLFVKIKNSEDLIQHQLSPEVSLETAEEDLLSSKTESIPIVDTEGGERAESYDYYSGKGDYYGGEFYVDPKLRFFSTKYAQGPRNNCAKSFSTPYFENIALNYENDRGLETNTVQYFIRTQIEYLFSEQNLIGDIFLRRQMDCHGFVPIALVALFPRIQTLTNDLSFVIESVISSDLIQMDGFKIRSKINPTRWPILN